MKLEHYEEWISWMEGRNFYRVTMLRKEARKFLDVAKAARIHIERWERLASFDIRASQLMHSEFDPSHKPLDMLGLKEALEALEQVEGEEPLEERTPAKKELEKDE